MARSTVVAAALVLLAAASAAAAPGGPAEACSAMVEALGSQRDIMTADDAERVLLEMDSLEELRGAAVAMLRAGCRRDAAPTRRSTADAPPADADAATKIGTGEFSPAARDDPVSDELSEVQRREWQALVDLDAATHPFTFSSFPSHLGWKLDAPVTVCDRDGGANSSWLAVSCAGGRVSGLHLSFAGNSHLHTNLHGTLPASLSDLAGLEVFDVSNNAISGSLPPEWSAWRNVSFFSVAACPINGTLPPEWSSWTRVSHFDVTSTSNFGGGSLTGTLPAAWSSWAGPSVFRADENRISGALPAAWSSWRGVDTFSVAQGALDGTLPVAWAPWAPSAFSVAGNRISGPLPASWSRWPGPASFTVANNRLGGSLPDAWSSWVAASEFYAAGNLISGTLPESWAAWRGITVFSAADNRISGALHEAWTLQWPVERLDLSNNRLEGSLWYASGWDKAMDLYLDRNRFSGPVPPVYGPNIERVDLGGNLLSGQVYPYFPGNSRLALFRVRDNAGLFDCMATTLLDTPAAIDITGTGIDTDRGDVSGGCVTRSLVEAAPTQRTVYPLSGNLTCPTWHAAGLRGGAISADANFLGYDQCRCGDGKVWSNASSQCEPCPAAFAGRARCDPFVLAPRHCLLGDQYPARRRDGALARDLSPLDEVALLQCRRPGLCNTGAEDCSTNAFDDAENHTPFNASHPEPLQFSCAAGHDRESLMCSRCEDGHWRNGDACLGCPASFVVLVPLVLLVSLVLVAWYLWRSYNERHTYYRTLAVALFWLQVTHLLEASAQVQGAHSSSSTWQWVATLRATLESWAVFNPLAAQCVHGGVDFVAQSYAVLLAPALMGMLTFLGSHSAQFTYVALYVLQAMFLPVVTRALQVLRCESQLGSVSYVSAAPYVLCDDPRLLPLRAVAGAVLALYAVPVMAVVWRAPWQHTHAPRPPSSRPLETLSRPLMDAGDDEEVESAEAPPPAVPLVERLLLGSLRDPAGLWWWPAAYEMGRGLSLALLVGLVPSTSPLLPVGVFLVLSVSALAHGRYLPSRMALDAALEMAVLLAAMAVYLLSIVGGAAATTQAEHLEGDTDGLRVTRALVSLVHVTMLSALGCGLAWPSYLKWRSSRS